MTTAIRTQRPTPTPEQVVGYRIMRETEIAPHWWATPVEIGETGSGAVAFGFCDEQNAVTMNPNVLKRQRYFVEPILAALTATNPVIAEHRRIELIVSGMKAGDTAVINGSEVVAVSLAEALQVSAMSAADRLAHDLASYVRPKAGV